MAEVDMQDDEAKWRNLWNQQRFAEAEVILQKLSASEKKPGVATLYLGAARTIQTRDRKYVDDAAKRVRRRVPRDQVLALCGKTLWCIGHEKDSIVLLLQAASMNPSQENVSDVAARLIEMG